MKGLFLLAAGVQLASAAPAPQFNGAPTGFPPGFFSNYPKGPPPKSTSRQNRPAPPSPSRALPTSVTVGLTLSPAQPAPPRPTTSLPIGLTLSPKSTATSTPQGFRPVPNEAKPPQPSGPPCRNIPGDPGWPNDNVWKSELPGVITVEQKKDEKHPNYHYSARNHGDVQAAVNFAGRHHVRLSIIASGHVSGI
jgi:hypothetical protein